MKIEFGLLLFKTSITKCGCFCFKAKQQSNAMLLSGHLNLHFSMLLYTFTASLKDSGVF